jgi:hypothetical protein
VVGGEEAVVAGEVTLQLDRVVGAEHHQGSRSCSRLRDAALRTIHPLVIAGP